jgi:tetratricopeptide (TPR) repeat protein
MSAPGAHLPAPGSPRGRRVLIPALAVSLGLSLGVAGRVAAQASSPATAATRASSAPSGFDPLAKKAAEAKAAGRFAQAIELYRQGIKLRSDWMEGRFALGTILYDQDRYDEAREEFRRVAAAQPKNGVVVALRGLCGFQLRDYERALSDLELARSLGIPAKEVASVANFQAAILMNRFERYESAFEILKEFALLDRDNPSVIEAFGLSVLRLPYLPSEAPPDKREMILMAGRAAYHQARGRDTATARQFFAELASRYPAVPNVHYAFGVCLLVEDPAAALEEFRRELRISPNHVHAMLQTAFELMRQGQYAEAQTLAQKAVDLDPSLFAAHQALGRALLENGEVDRSIQELETGAKLAPESPEMFFTLARAYAKKGRSEDATRARETFLRLDSKRRTARSGPQSVGGMRPEPETTPAESAPPEPE